MNLLERIARKILKEEIERDKEKIKTFSKDSDELREENLKLRAENNSLKTQLYDLRTFSDDTMKENEMLREYYKVDEEPSDEIKARMLINIEVNHEIRRLRELNVMQSRAHMTSMIIASQNTSLYCRPYNYPLL